MTTDADEFPPLPPPPPVPPVPKPAPSPRGIACPDCCRTNLHVESVRHPCAGRTVRYYRCQDCGGRVISEEVFSSTRRPKGRRPRDLVPRPTR